MRNITRMTFWVLGFFFMSSLQAQNQLCLLSTHPYYQVVSLSNGGSALTDYQIKITVNTSTLVAQSKMMSNGNDIRFMDQSCNSLNYWIESGMNTASTVIWIKVTSVPVGSSKIYLYYGQSGASAASDATKVFDLYDDFSGTSLNTSIWTQTASGYTTTVSGGTITLSGSGYNNILSKSTFSANLISEMYVTSLSGYWPHIGQFVGTPSGDGVCLLYSPSNVISGYMPNQSDAYGANFYQYLTIGSTTGIWSISWPSTNNLIYSWPGGGGNYLTTPTKPTNIRGTFGCLSSGAGSLTLDWYRMRKYAAVIPTVSISGENPNYNLDIIAILDGNGNPATKFCGGESYYVQQTIMGNYTLGNLYYQLQLSDANGSFSSPTILGSVSGGANTYTISTITFGNYVLSNNLPYGTNYRIRGMMVSPGSPIFSGNPSAALTIGASPAATDFTINSAAQCDEQDLFKFTALGTIATSNTLSRDWNYDDGNTGSGSPVTHSYSTYGTYNVTLKAYNKDLPKCSTNITKPVVVYPQPEAVINASSWQNCPKIDQYFDAYSSSVATGSLSSYSWDFGDGGTGSNSYEYHSYNSFGNFTVNLIVTSNYGCKDTATITKTIYPNPVVNFTTDLACDGHDVQFYDKSTVNSFGGSSLTGSNTYRYYIFGDGSEQYDKNPKHLYSSTGTYSVFLQVQTNKNCYDTIRKNIVVNPSPTAKFLAQNACLSDNVNITNQSTISSGTMTYKWDLGDGTSSVATTPSPTYTQSGTYNIRLKATSNAGCTDSTNQNVVIYKMPIAQFSGTNECLGTAHTFTNYSVDAASVKWTFESGQTSVSQNPTYTYGSDGTKTVLLEVSSQNGCKNSITKNIEVWPLPVASFTSSTASSCLNLHEYSFNNTSNISSGTFSSYWEFGDNTVSNILSPKKKYNSSGNYSVGLNITSNKGCKNSTTQNIVVNPHPIAEFSFTDACTDNNIPFTNNSSISTGSISSFAWNFGDNTFSNSTNPSKSYNTAGSYLVSLVATSAAGCNASISHTVMSWPNPTISFTVDDVCKGLSNKFTNNSGVSSGFIAAYDWTFGDGGNSSEINPSHLYASAGAYSVSLKGTTDKGCIASSSGNANVWPQPIANFTTNNVCQGLASIFTNTSSISGGSISSQNWVFGDGNVSTVLNPSHTYNTYGNYTVTLTVNSDKNCSADISKETKVYRQPVAKIYASTLKTSVLQPVINFSDNSLFGDYSDWAFGFNTRTSMNNSDTCSYFKPGNYKVTLKSSTVDHCSDTDTAIIVVENGYTIYFPNTFTPNDDNLNDAFGAVGIFEGITAYSLNVLDNRGRVLFSTTNIHSKWNGKPDGSTELVPAGNYTWFADYTDYKGTKHSINGVISIRQ